MKSQNSFLCAYLAFFLIIISLSTLIITSVVYLQFFQMEPQPLLIHFKNQQHQSTRQQLPSRECKRILWVMGMVWDYKNFDSINRIKYAVISHKLRAPSLLPMLMFKGPEAHPFVSWLQTNGVIVCNIKNSIQNELILNDIRASQQESYYKIVVNEYIEKCLYSYNDQKNIFSQQIDLSYVLYTDTAVSFLHDIDACNIFKPRVIAFGPDHYTGEIMKNTGVLVFNMPQYLRYQQKFFDFCREHQWTYQTREQELFLEYFRDGSLSDPLPAGWNWKPYWERPASNISVYILHYQGTNPGTNCWDCLTQGQLHNFSEANLTCVVCGNYVNELLLSRAATDDFSMYTNLVHDWKELVFQDKPYYNTTSKQLEV
eukprot:TRINITY_DN782_c0_g2_i3.p1 TRINITY_DN782_c0_g2~~TRINITY_DN782_c0_g2_i3.p1  ORF type:complete len:395 (+),score=-4.53 TRINITY_DN782_c0_g2_i3:73-1185(+)